MLLKPNKNKKLDSFLRRLEKRVTKSLKLSQDKYDFEDRVQFSLCWLLLYMLFSKYEFFLKKKDLFADIEELKSLLISKFDEMVVYQTSKGNAKIKKDLDKLMKEGKVTRNLLDAYLEEHKTDVELKILAALFGLKFTFIPEDQGGDASGVISNLDPRTPENYLKKINVLAKHIRDGGVIALYEYHWLALRDIEKRLEAFKEQEASNDSIQSITTTPHSFRFNNSLSGTILKISKLETVGKYQFYVFELDNQVQNEFLNLLKNEIK
ncbi:MAG: hypothetical protein ACFFCS_14760 [Candidatus Hodarchaeota archaeon]